ATFSHLPAGLRTSRLTTVDFSTRRTMGSFGAPGFVRLGWPAMTRQPLANAQEVNSSFVNDDILRSLKGAQEPGDRFPLPCCPDRACHNAMSAALLNATRTPVLPRLTRILPPFCALCSANHCMTSGSSLVLPSNSSTPTISSSLRRFTIVACFLEVSRRGVVSSNGNSGTRVASHGDSPVCHALTGCR